MRTIQKVIDETTQDEINANDFFAQSEDIIFNKRHELEKAYQLNEKLFVCELCRQPVKIISRNFGKRIDHKSLFFAHYADKGDCPIKTGQKYSKEEFFRMRYNGQKESDRHYLLKNYLADSLRSDGRFEDIKVEKRYNGVCKKWRQPDVSAKFMDKNIAFELQLATTFLNVIVERTMFYHRNKTYIIWFFDNSRKNIDSMRFTEKDIFYPNNKNCFFLDSKINEEKFTFLCGYVTPYYERDEIKDKWCKEKITIDDLTFKDNFKVYYFDYQKQCEKLERNIVRIKKKQRIEQFESEWITSGNIYYKEFLGKYSDLFDVNEIQGIKRLLDVLYTLKYKKVIGYNYEKEIQVLHIFIHSDMQSNEHFGELVFKAINIYNLRSYILNQDHNEKFRDKARNYKSQNLAYCKDYDKTLKILFPELF